MPYSNWRDTSTVSCRRFLRYLTKRRRGITLARMTSMYCNMCIRGQLFSRIVFLILCLIASLATPHLSASETKTATSDGWSPANIPGIDGLVEATRTEVKRTGNQLRIAMFDDVRDVVAHASEWRWFSRDNGVLLAIPVRERLGISAKVEGERALAEVVRRLINQAGWGNPPVQVVLTEHKESHPTHPPTPPCCSIPCTVPCWGCE